MVWHYGRGRRSKATGPVNRHTSGMEMSGSPDHHPPVPVIVVGPSPDSLGGMASVVGQVLDMDFGGRYQPILLPITLASDQGESAPARLMRHTRQVRILQTTIRETGAPIVHIHTCSGWSFYRSVVDLLVAQEQGGRVILHIHGAKFDAFFAKEPVWRRRVIARALSRADRVVALSSGWREKLSKMAPAARVAVIENAVEIPASVQAPEPSERCRFVLLARMDEWKGIDDLLSACRCLHEGETALNLTLAGPPGTAGDETVLNDKIRELGLTGTVRYVGAVHGRQKSALLASADAYVQPSHHEGMPIAMLEALSYGLPVVATRVGAVPEMITEGHSGLLVPPHRPDLLAQAMQRIASNTACRRAMSYAARALARDRFSTTRLRRDLLSLYQGIMADRGRPTWEPEPMPLQSCVSSPHAVPDPVPCIDFTP